MVDSGFDGVGWRGGLRCSDSASERHDDVSRLGIRP